MFSIAKIYRQRNLPLECAHWMLQALNVEGGIDSDLIRDQASQLGSFTHQLSIRGEIEKFLTSICW